MRTSFFAAIALVFAAITGCGDGAEQAVPASFTDETMTQFRPYAQGEYVIRTRSQLQAAWAAAPFAVFPVGLVTSEPAFPEYDFQSSMLVGVSLGIGKWCFAPVITQVLVVGDDMDVEYKIRAISTLACMFNAPLISFALVPRVTGSVAFRNGGTL
ncbi:MAG TPA: hypothetical protein VLJ62_13735 [Burkholderiaceae bacterium]|nr:hypothetical protein [Burkholderiaceae bacterium]